jgi:hypothetical protein
MEIQGGKSLGGWEEKISKITHRCYKKVAPIGLLMAQKIP